MLGIGATDDKWRTARVLPTAALVATPPLLLRRDPSLLILDPIMKLSLFTRDGRPAPERVLRGEGGVPTPPHKNDQNRREVAGQNKGPNLNFLQ